MSATAKKTRLWRLISALALLALSAACSTKPVIQIKTVAVLPPAAMMMPVVEPRFSGDTTEDVVNYALELRGAVRECNANMEALRAWRDGDSLRDNAWPGGVE